MPTTHQKHQQHRTKLIIRELNPAPNSPAPWQLQPLRRRLALLDAGIEISITAQHSRLVVVAAPLLLIATAAARTAFAPAHTPISTSTTTTTTTTTANHRDEPAAPVPAHGAAPCLVGGRLAGARQQIGFARRGPRQRPLAERGGAQQVADLEKVVLQGVDKALGLPVVRRHRHRDGLVLDDVADAEAVGRGRAETECSQRRVAAVGRRQDRVV